MGYYDIHEDEGYFDRRDRIYREADRAARDIGFGDDPNWATGRLRREVRGYSEREWARRRLADQLRWEGLTTSEADDIARREVY